MFRFQYGLVFLLCAKVLHGAPSEGKDIADRFGDDLNFASKQFVRGFTSIFGPILDTIQDLPSGFKKFIPVGGGGSPEDSANFRYVLLRDGVSALGKGVKAGSTILTVPIRVTGTGLEEARKVGQAAGVTSISSEKRASVSMDDKTKIASTLLNTTASEFSQANLGAVLVEVALKNRVKDIGNQTATFVQSQRPKDIETRSTVNSNEPTPVAKEEEPKKTSPQVDQLLERFNEAVKQNDERVLNALKAVLAQINPPKN